MALLLMLFKTLNIPVAPHKTVGPSTCLEYLGIILDSTALEACLPVNKVQRINIILLFWIRKLVRKGSYLAYWVIQILLVELSDLDVRSYPTSYFYPRE